MGTVVYQGFNESQLVETRAQNILRLRLLSSPRPHCSSLPLKLRTLDSSADKLSDDIAKCQLDEISQKTSPIVVHKSSNSSTDSGGWSFLQALDNSFDSTKESKKQSTYVHPLVKKSNSSTLSGKSLELCTESLGSESGSDIIEDSIFMNSSVEVSSKTNPITTSDIEGNSPTREQEIMKPRQVFGTKASCRSFPPPLTTMSGSKSIQVRPHREDGRLIIEAIENPSTQNYFHAERSNGRLRLSFVGDFTSIFDSSANDTSSIEDNNEEEENQNDVVNYDADQEYEEDEEEQEQEEETEDEVNEEEMDSYNNMDIGDEMQGRDELQRRSRCKEGELEKGRIINNWEHLCVATS